jgi:hypothetical protein
MGGNDIKDEDLAAYKVQRSKTNVLEIQKSLKELEKKQK